MIIQVAYRQDLKFNHELTSPKNRDRVQITLLEKKTLEYLFAWKDIQASEVETDFVLS